MYSLSDSAMSSYSVLYCIDSTKSFSYGYSTASMIVRYSIVYRLCYCNNVYIDYSLAFSWSTNTQPCKFTILSYIITPTTYLAYLDDVAGCALLCIIANVQFM